MPDLTNMHCQKSTTLTKLDSVDEYLAQIPSWNIGTDTISICRRFEFKNFKQTMFFINAAAYICEQQGHHPDAKFGFNYCEISFTTHDVGGLSMNDFICAAKLDTLVTL